MKYSWGFFVVDVITFGVVFTLGLGLGFSLLGCALYAGCTLLLAATGYEITMRRWRRKNA